MQPNRSYCLTAALAFAPLLALPAVAQAAIVANPTPSPQCGDNTAFFNPTLPPNIVLPAGFTASVFAFGLNTPTGIAFRGDASNFEVFVLESGHGIPSVCNDQSLWPGGEFASDNPFTPDILVFNKNGKKIRGPLVSQHLTAVVSSPKDQRSTSLLSTVFREDPSSRRIQTSRPTSTTAKITAHALSS
jgi:hypothetical protein